jgi:iron complex transport system substrate-binding protein
VANTLEGRAVRPRQAFACRGDHPASTTKEDLYVKHKLGAGLLAAALSLTLVACGSDDTAPVASGEGPSTTAAAADFPVTVRGVTIEAAPKAIVSLTPSATEDLFAIGAGDQVVAADKNSNYPPEAPTTDLDAYQPNVEAIASEDPDLVIASNDTESMVKGLRDLDIPVLLLPAATTLDEAYGEIVDLGRATGHADEAAEVVEDIKGKLADIVLKSGAAAKGLTYYYELDSTFYSVTSRTFIGHVLGLLGLVNIADTAGAKASDYPQLSAEFIVQQDPDLVLLADTKCCQQDAAAVAERQGWSGMKAVTGNGVVTLDDDIASRWGPRITDLLQAVADGVAKVKGSE